MKRLFEQLECPVLHLLDDLNSVHSQATLIGWLEDRKIREYEIDQRTSLKTMSPDWPSAVSEYLTALQCPYPTWLPQPGSTIPSANKRCLQWLASYATSLDYDDAIGEPEDTHAMEEDEDAPLNVSTDRLALLELGKSIGIELRENESIGDFMERVHSQLRIVLADIQRLRSNAKLPDLPLGFSTQDASLDEIALVLKVLHIRDMRSLQSELNDLTVLAQAHTARPRLDAAQVVLLGSCLLTSHVESKPIHLAEMKLLQIRVGMTQPPAVYEDMLEKWPEKEYSSGYLKSPVDSVKATESGLEGNDTGYPTHIEYASYRTALVFNELLWESFERELPGSSQKMHRGCFGENFVVNDPALLPSEVCVGDTYAIGTAVFRVTGPRMPCPKVDAFLGTEGVTALGKRTSWTGYFLQVIQPGYCSTDDEIRLMERPHPGLTMERIAKGLWGLPEELETSEEFYSALVGADSLMPRHYRDTAALRLERLKASSS